MATKEQIEGIKLIGEWCKWYAAIDTAAIAGIGALLKLDPVHPLSLWARIPCVVAVSAFVTSIVFAAWTLSSLPEAVQDIWEDDTREDIADHERQNKIWNRPGNLFGMTFNFAYLCKWQLASFFVGICGFAIMVIAMAFSRH